MYLVTLVNQRTDSFTDSLCCVPKNVGALLFWILSKLLISLNKAAECCRNFASLTIIGNYDIYFKFDVDKSGTFIERTTAIQSKFGKKNSRKLTRVYHLRNNLLRRSPVHQAVMGKTPIKNLVREPCAQGWDLVRLRSAPHRWNFGTLCFFFKLCFPLQKKCRRIL